MAEAPELVINLIFGRWRSQILYAGAALGVFDHLAEDRATSAATLAPQIRADPALPPTGSLGRSPRSVCLQTRPKRFPPYRSRRALAEGSSALAARDGIA